MRSAFYSDKPVRGVRMSIFEIIMLVCFGAAWPFSIYRSWHSRSTAGKSAAFLLIVWFGYVAGIIHKLVYSYNIVIIFYIINLFMVSADIALYIRNRVYYTSKS
jgi:hypothetical protein